MRLKRHPSFETLAAHAGGALTGAEAERVRRHLDRPCSKCQAELELLGELRAAVTQPRLESAPAGLIRQARAAFDQRVRLGLFGARRPLGARLLYDSVLAPQFAGVRGPASGRQLLYRVGELEIDLRLGEREGQRRHLQGQILIVGGGSIADLRLTLRVAGRRRAASTDALGQFALAGVPARAFALEVCSGPTPLARLKLPGAAAR
jgi:hypothetical protein